MVLSHYLLLKSAPKSPSGSARGEKAPLAGSLTWFWLLTAVMGRRSTPPSRPARGEKAPLAGSLTCFWLLLSVLAVLSASDSLTCFWLLINN